MAPSVAWDEKPPFAAQRRLFLELDKKHCAQRLLQRMCHLCTNRRANDKITLVFGGHEHKAVAKPKSARIRRNQWEIKEIG